MKRFLLLSLLTVLMAAAFAQTPLCPFTYKSNVGGGGCAHISTNCTSTLSATINLTYTVAPPSLPTVISVTESGGAGETYLFECATSDWASADHLEVRICFYANAQNNNFFNQQGNLDIVLTYDGGTTIQPCTVEPPEEGTLPIVLKSFTAKRNQSSVNLLWTTSQEINNTGFEVQRLIGAGRWMPIVFIPTQALGGNSNIELTYSYNEVNNIRGITQYRLKQVDIDNQHRFSYIQAVRGLLQRPTIVIYPNPGNGKTSVTLEDTNDTFDLLLTDINGKLLRQWRKVANNTVLIDGLMPGVYNLKIVNKDTGDWDTRKIVIVNK